MALNIDSMTASQIAAGVAAGEFSATEVAKASLEAIEAREGAVQAFLQVTPELALDAAAKIDDARAPCRCAAGHQRQHEPCGHAYHLRFSYARELRERLYRHLRRAHAPGGMPSYG